jgi:hypothetical protein
MLSDVIITLHVYLLLLAAININLRPWIEEGSSEGVMNDSYVDA